jgi:hypothetical protein
MLPHQHQTCPVQHQNGTLGHGLMPPSYVKPYVKRKGIQRLIEVPNDEPDLRVEESVRHCLKMLADQLML